MIVKQRETIQRLEQELGTRGSEYLPTAACPAACFAFRTSLIFRGDKIYNIYKSYNLDKGMSGLASRRFVLGGRVCREGYRRARARLIAVSIDATGSVA